MSVVALAGGTGALGAPFLAALKASTKHNVIVLSRGAAKEQDSQYPVVTVDYSDVDGTAKLLQSHNATSIISTIRVWSEEPGIAQANLVKAAAKSGTVKQFIASDFEVPHPGLRPDRFKFRELAADELRKTNLQWTRVYNGYFIDHWSIPNFQTYLRNVDFGLDLKNKVASIPGTGNEPMTFSYTLDVARLVVASLSLPSWEENTFAYSDKSTLNEALRLAEEVRGKFDVAHDEPEKLKRGEMTELPSHVPIYPFLPKERFQAIFAEHGLDIINGLGDLPTTGTLNEKFPEIETLKLKDVMAKWKNL